MRETWVWFLGREDPLEKEMAIHSSTLAWKIPWTEEPDRLQSMGSQRVGHDWATSLSLSSTLNGGFSSGSDGKESGCNAGDPGSIPGSGRSPGEGNGYHTSIPAGEFHGQRRLEDYSPRGCRVTHNWATKYSKYSNYTDTLLVQLMSNLYLLLPYPVRLSRFMWRFAWSTELAKKMEILFIPYFSHLSVLPAMSGVRPQQGSSETRAMPGSGEG